MPSCTNALVPDLNPQTWDQFLDNCERLKRAGIVPITQDGIHWYTSWWFDHLAQRILGADKVRQAFRDPQRRIQWTEPGFLQAARMVEKMLDKGYFAEGICWPQSHRVRAFILAGGGRRPSLSAVGLLVAGPQ